jgi:hypothetical protein
MDHDPLSQLLARRLAGDQGSLPDDDNSRHELPVLWSFLTRRDVDGNLAKEPAAINLRLGLGQWLVTLTDPSLEVSLTVVVPVLAQALHSLEAAAQSPAAPWQPWKRSKGKFEKLNSRTPGQGANGSNT